MTVIFGPAEGIAAAKCLAARSLSTTALTVGHEGRCVWCSEDLVDLRHLVDGFNAWAGWKPAGQGDGTAERHEVRLFLELPREEQRRQVEAAQAITAPAEPPSDDGGRGVEILPTSAAGGTVRQQRTRDVITADPNPEPVDAAEPEGPAWL